jgi:fimbrial isopeptide formation D2 family protein/LPXTG-motif cell wall-anchored protein
MKFLRKVMTMVIAMLMAMTTTNVAFAASDGSITISNATVEKVYKAYKIFDLTYSGSGDSKNVAYTIDSEWKDFFNGNGAGYITDTNTGNLNPINVDGEIKYINITDETTDEFAADALAYATALTPDKSVEANSTTVELAGLALGYYLVYPEGASGIDTANKWSSICSLTSTTPNATIKAKAVYPTVDKQIDENGTLVDANEASIGDTITYVITSTVPDYTGYDWYKLVFNDTLSKGLKFESLTSIKIGGTTLSDNAYEVKAGTYDATNGTNIRFVIKDIVEAGYAAGASIEITYTATLNENAVIDAPNTNSVMLEYTNNPKYTKEHGKTPDYDDDFEDNDPKGETPEEVTKTYTTAIKINKTDSSSVALSGAEFELTGNGVNVVITAYDEFTVDEDGDYWKLNDGTYTTDDPTTDGIDSTKYADTTVKYSKVTTTSTNTDTTKVSAKAFVGPDGVLIFQGLGAGNYKISETTVPNGYNRAKDIEFTVSFTYDSDNDKGIFVSSNDAVSFKEAIHMFNTKIVNNSGAELPSTGGIGTTIFYIVGGVMVAGAVIFLLTKRRVAGNE